VAAFASCGRPSKPRLNVYNWSAYVAPDTISNFEAEFGATVRYALTKSNEEMLAKVITGNSGWDVVFPTYTRIKPMLAMACFSHSTTMASQSDNLDPRFRNPFGTRT